MWSIEFKKKNQKQIHIYLSKFYAYDYYGNSISWEYLIESVEPNGTITIIMIMLLFGFDLGCILEEWIHRPDPLILFVKQQEIKDYIPSCVSNEHSKNINSHN